MVKRDFNAEFKEMMIHEAACERHLKGVHEYLLLGKTALVSDWFVNDVDSSELYADIAEHYGLTPDETQQAVDICEDTIMEEVWYV